ncbi:ATP-binding cassette domain-containing protein [Sphingobium fluviale]|uniref:ATP-binding cassette domain-containing protein n=1 Tax=Sphingobium fluviale TaxID=2506423 RepID=A0A4V1N3Q2_9SPHN|nr:ATP-binding cassette domain-containing protein [Sphingobium fluviale]RXR29456.1 ATP-binding cassette domain-containing protein [Sphingobium fluviale]
MDIEQLYIIDRPSLTQRLFGMLARKARKNDAKTHSVWAGLVAPLSTVGAIEALSKQCGKPTAREVLTAALPVGDGDMDPRFAQVALARAGLEARWERVPLGRLAATDMPCLMPLMDGGAVILLALPDRKTALVLDSDGEKQVPREALDSLAFGDILICGHVDPENGLGFDEERDFVRRNPRLWALGVFLSERKRLVQMLAAAAFMNLTALAIPLYMRAIYDRVVPNLAIESLWALSAGIIMVLVFEFLFRHARMTFVDAVAVRVGQAVQHRAMTSFLNGRLGRRDNNVGSLMTALRDVEGLAMLVPQMLVTFLVDVPFFFAFVVLIGMIAGLTATGPLIGAAAMVFIGAVAAYASKLSAKRATKLMQARNNLVVDVAEGLTTIKANQAEGRFLRQWDIVSDHIGMAGRAARKWNDMPGSVSTLLVQLVTVMVIIIGVFQIKAGVMTTGALVAATMLAGRAMVPVSGAIAMISKGYQSLSQFAGLADLLAMEPERDVSDPSIRRTEITGDIRLRGLSFTYEGAAEQSLRGISLAVEPGEKIALIGRSGSGKSTLLQLLSGMLSPGEGAITVDGHAMDQFASSHLRQSIVYSGQDAVLFNTSIWDNILLGMEEPDPAVVERAIRAAGLDRFIDRSVEGYTRKVGPRGAHLSGGQRQSVLIARAMVRNPAILLLDEPTANMDIDSEQAVINGLRQAAADTTVIVATHRMALLDLVDRVIWLEEGRVFADKPKQEVLALLRGQQQQKAA